jgi:uncharacterized coiled-coil protein SlyX
MVSTEDDAWIALLNDISLNRSYPVPNNHEKKVASSKVLMKAVKPVSFDDEIFFNDDGEPTDRFLEAVNADLKKHSTFDQQVDIGGVAIDGGFKSRNEFEKNLLFSTLKNTVRQGKESGKMHFSRRSLPTGPSDEISSEMMASSSSTQQGINKPSVNRKAPLSSKCESSVLDDNFDLNDIENDSTNNVSAFKKEGICHNSDNEDREEDNIFLQSTDFSNIPKNCLKLLKREKSDSNFVSKSPKANKTKKNNDVKDHLAVSRSAKMKTIGHVSANKVTGDLSSSFHDSVLTTVATDSRRCHEMIESESKLKSFKLRLQGQLATIRSLEQQLQQASDLLKVRNTQIIQLQSKLKSLNDSYQQSQQQSPLRNGNNSDFEAKFEEVIDQYKVNPLHLGTLLSHVPLLPSLLLSVIFRPKWIFFKENFKMKSAKDTVWKKEVKL